MGVGYNTNKYLVDDDVEQIIYDAEQSVAIAFEIANETALSANNALGWEQELHAKRDNARILAHAAYMRALDTDPRGLAVALINNHLDSSSHKDVIMAIGYRKYVDELTCAVKEAITETNDAKLISIEATVDYELACQEMKRVLELYPFEYS